MLPRSASTAGTEGDGSGKILDGRAQVGALAQDGKGLHAENSGSEPDRSYRDRRCQMSAKVITSGAEEGLLGWLAGLLDEVALIRDAYNFLCVADAVVAALVAGW